MSEQKLKNISLKLAEALLIYKGEISIEELNSLPFIDENEAKQIAAFLSKKFNLRIYDRKLRNAEREKIISLL